MTPIILEALAAAVVPVIVALSVCAKVAVPVKLTILAITTSSVADRILVDIVFLDIVIILYVAVPTNL
jgi:hypothetical protein